MIIQGAYGPSSYGVNKPTFPRKETLKAQHGEEFPQPHIAFGKNDKSKRKKWMLLPAAGILAFAMQKTGMLNQWISSPPPDPATLQSLLHLNNVDDSVFKVLESDQVISLDDAVQLAEKGLVNSVEPAIVLWKSGILMELKPHSVEELKKPRMVKVQLTTSEEFDKLNISLNKHGVRIKELDEVSPWYNNRYVESFFTTLVLVGLLVYAQKMMMFQSSLRKKGISFDKRPDINLDDVGGLPKSKIGELRQHIAKLNQVVAQSIPGKLALKNKGMELLQQVAPPPITQVNEIPGFGWKPGVMIMFKGPPGIGKTMVAKAIAGEANVPFFAMSGSDFINKFVGVGADNIGYLFKTAREHAPCVVFIDEIDSIAQQRDNGGGDSSSSERRQTLNKLLAELDGFGDNSKVMVVAATNSNNIDKALTRPGRFQEVALQGPIAPWQRRDIFQKTTRRMERQMRKENPRLPKDYELFSKDINWERMVDLTANRSGAVISGTLEKAIAVAREEKAAQVKMEHLLEGFERMMIGDPEPEMMEGSEADRKFTGLHESGHALTLLGWNKVFPGLYNLIAFSMVPRGGSLGHILQTRNGLEFNQDLKDIITDQSITLGGRAIEEITRGALGVTTGGANDWDVAASRLLMATKAGMFRGHNVSVLKKEQQGQAQTGTDENELHEWCFERTYKATFDYLQKIQEQLGANFYDKLSEKSLEMKGTLWEKDAENFLTGQLDDISQQLYGHPFNWEPALEPLKELLEDIVKRQQNGKDRRLTPRTSEKTNS